ncbi:MAG: fructose-bisphosphate aldolase, partial [Alphaproteobacteria bacterium]|nr:fructose-bisphosphate aldolase [Alphaproteobacteria bacterium]
KAYADIDTSTLTKRLAHVVQSFFNGRRLVVFSGGEAKGLDGILGEIREIAAGGATGSIIGRNTFQRPRDEAIAMLNQIIDIYKGRG